MKEECNVITLLTIKKESEGLKNLNAIVAVHRLAMKRTWESKFKKKMFMEREGKKIRLKMLKLPVTEAQRRLRTTWGLPVFMPPSGGPGLVSPGNSLPEVTHSCEGQQHNQRAHHIGPENKQLGLCPTALVAMKTHLAKIYLFDQEYKSHFRNMCSYKLKHDNCYLYYVSDRCPLGKCLRVPSFKVQVVSPNHSMVIPSRQGIWGICSGQQRCHFSHPLIFSRVTCTKPENCHWGYRPLNYSFGRSGLVPPIT